MRLMSKEESDWLCFMDADSGINTEQLRITELIETYKRYGTYVEVGDVPAHWVSAYTWQNRRGSSNGSQHIVLLGDFEQGRIKRSVGQLLCSSTKKHWDYMVDRVPNEKEQCQRCADLLAKAKGF